MDDDQVIRSKDNRRLVYARSVRDGKEPNAIFIEGKRQCLEALRAGIAVELVLLSESFDDRDSINAFSSEASKIVRVADRTFVGVCETPSPQGIAVIATRPNSRFPDLAASIARSAVPLVLYLSEINNPSNLGAILRTAEAAGIAGVIISRGSADPFSPKTNRSALGANLRIPIIERVTDEEMQTFAAESGLRTAAAVVSSAEDYSNVDWKQPTLIMLGSEAHGLSDALVSAADFRVTIPLANGVESLNLAVSAGILLFEAVSQYRKS